MTFEEKLAMYARLMVERGINVQKGQLVHIIFDSGSIAPLAEIARAYAYKRGAKHVELVYDAPYGKYHQLKCSDSADQFYFPPHYMSRFRHVVENRGCVLDIRSDPEPDLFKYMGKQSAQFKQAQMNAREPFYSQGINQGLVSWAIACPPSVAAAQKVFPYVSKEAALELYWHAVFRMTMTDTEDCFERWKVLDETLARRCKLLTEARIAELRFLGPGTDLKVGLSHQAIWRTSKKETVAGISIASNIPSYEVYTTPDRRLTSGKVRITRPVQIAGTIIRDLQLIFQSGKIASVHAPLHSDVFRSLIETDEGARMLGEVALVGIDSPIYQEGKSFYNGIYDENAACHIAPGMAYKYGLRDGWDRTGEDLESLGWNNSRIHEDLMVSDERADVDAVTFAGHRIALIRKGEWVEPFR